MEPWTQIVAVTRKLVVHSKTISIYLLFDTIYQSPLPLTIQKCLEAFKLITSEFILHSRSSKRWFFLRFKLHETKMLKWNDMTAENQHRNKREKILEFRSTVKNWLFFISQCLWRLVLANSYLHTSHCENIYVST